MIKAEQAEVVSKHVAKRAKTMRVRTLSPFSFLVIPTEPGKAVRVVHFDYQKTVRIDCSEWDTGVSCPANSYSDHCSHVEAAIKQLLKNAKRNNLIDVTTEQERNRRIQAYARRVVKERQQFELRGVEK